jgi:hypothetical protein
MPIAATVHQQETEAAGLPARGARGLAGLYFRTCHARVNPGAVTPPSQRHVSNKGAASQWQTRTRAASLRSQRDKIGHPDGALGGFDVILQSFDMGLFSLHLPAGLHHSLLQADRLHLDPTRIGQPRDVTSHLRSRWGLGGIGGSLFAP